MRVGGRRRSRPEAVRMLAVVDAAQRAGLGPDELRPLVEASAAGSATTGRLRELAARKLPELRARIERAELVPRGLELAAACACPGLDDCPLFDEPGRLPAPESRRFASPGRLARPGRLA